MRKLLAISLIIYISCDQKNDVTELGTLEIIPTYCKYGNNPNYLIPRIKLFKGKGLTREIKLNDKNRVPGKENIIVPDLEYGDYVLEYVTIYNEKIKTEFEIDKPNFDKELCFDYLDYKANKNVLLIDDLKNGEAIIIDYFHEGCFDTSEKPEILKIEKSNGVITAEYYSTKIILDSSLIRLLKEFEIELRCNHSYGCSSIDKFGITNLKTHESHAFIDGSCQWYGFKFLLKKLGFKT